MLDQTKFWLEKSSENKPFEFIIVVRIGTDGTLVEVSVERKLG